MAKKVTMASIGRELGISTVTVSKALSGQKGVSDQLREKILQTAQEMGYQRPLHSEEENAYTIGVVIAERYLDDRQSFYWRLYRLLSERVLECGAITIMEVVSMEDEREEELPVILQERKADGLIVMGAFSRRYAILLRESAEIPTVDLDTNLCCNGVDAVTADNYGGGYAMTSYLLSLGHSRIGYVGTLLATTSIDDRYLGYLKALMDHGIEVRRDWIVEDRDRRIGKIDEERKFLLPEEMPTAFFCNCDLSALALVRKLEQKGFRVPDDISVVGFDNYVLNQVEPPVLTTYEIDVKTMIARVVDRILYKIRHPGSVGGVMAVGGKFIERESAVRVGPEVPLL